MLYERVTYLTKPRKVHSQTVRAISVPEMVTAHKQAYRVSPTRALPTLLWTLPEANFYLFLTGDITEKLLQNCLWKRIQILPGC